MSKAFPTYLRELHSSLSTRWRPEDVLATISRGRPSAVPDVWRQQFRAAGSGKRPAYSLMSSDFHRPVGAARQLASAELAFGHPVEHSIDGDNPTDVRFVVECLANEIGGNRPKLTKAERKAAGIELSGRKYRRQWRAMRRLHYKAETLARQQQIRALELIGRSGFATTITLDRFAADPRAAHFIAYWVARKNLRREFTLDSRKNPMDEVAAWFLRQCVDAPDTDWEMIAMACPNPGIIRRLAPKQVGEMLGRWFHVMVQCAGYMKEAWPEGADKRTMIVRQGQDSSTWNTMATAYNSARSSWLACLTALGAESLLTASCPPKAMRLMAADLAYWHRSAGGDIDPNTHVWAALPMPWDVISGAQQCSLATVEYLCHSVGLDPQHSGWTAPRATSTHPVPFELTPELVHGVTVASPEWAALLRRAGVFSGKKLTSDPGLLADAVHGLTENVVVSDLPERRFVE